MKNLYVYIEIFFGSIIFVYYNVSLATFSCIQLTAFYFKSHNGCGISVLPNLFAFSCQCILTSNMLYLACSINQGKTNIYVNIITIIVMHSSSVFQNAAFWNSISLAKQRTWSLFCFRVQALRVIHYYFVLTFDSEQIMFHIKVLWHNKGTRIFIQICLIIWNKLKLKNGPLKFNVSCEAMFIKRSCN